MREIPSYLNMQHMERFAGYSQTENELLCRESTDIAELWTHMLPAVVIAAKCQGFLGYEYILIRLCLLSGQ